MSCDLYKLGSIVDKLKGMPTWIVVVIKLIKVTNCDISPKPEGPKNTAYNFTLTNEITKVIITDIDSLYVTFISFKMALYLNNCVKNINFYS